MSHLCRERCETYKAPIRPAIFQGDNGVASEFLGFPWGGKPVTKVLEKRCLKKCEMAWCDVASNVEYSKRL